MSAPSTPARRLVEAFGDCDALAAMYTDEVTWRLNYSLAPNIAGPHVGKDAVCAFNRAVFTKFYEPGSVKVEICDEIGDGASSVVRFVFRATESPREPIQCRIRALCEDYRRIDLRSRGIARHPCVERTAPGQCRRRSPQQVIRCRTHYQSDREIHEHSMV